ncbi:uncharacterized protein [Epargyreus clarus]|uniref:uncharacterized protein n=1 Tax=Epargyreus clarus TaxID=520877 RepID=UPI003C2E218C
MEQASCENGLQVGTRKGESHPSATAEGCPTYSGGGNNCLVGRQSAGLRKHDNRNPTTDSEMQNETGLTPAVQAATRKLRSSRGRRIGSPTPTVSSDADELSDCSLMSAVSTRSAATSACARKRALPTNGSEGERPKKRSVKPQAGRDDNFPVPLAPVAKTRAKASLPSAEELSRELTEQPTGDLGSHIIENLEIIEKVADKSRNLKGDMVRAIRLAVRHVQAAATEVVQRATTAHLEKENATLRSQLADLHGKMEALTAELNELRRENTTVRPELPRVEKRRVGNGEDALMERIGSIIDKKLASFKNELFPGRAIRPPLGKKATPARPPAAQAPLQRPVASSPAAQAETWVTVVGRKARAKERPPHPTRVEPARRQSPSCGRRKSASQRRPAVKAVPAPATQRPKKGRAGKRKTAKQRLPRVPKSAAVTVTVPEGSNITYAEVMKTAKSQIKLEDLGIAEVRQKKALNGGLLIEIAGEDCAGKADALAGKLQAVVSDMGVKVARPSKQGEARVMDLDDSVTQEDVAGAIAMACGCIATDIKVGQIRRRPSALGTAWVRCPLTAIRKLAAAKRLLVGWVSARVEVLPARSLQCFRCLETGHARHQCTSTKDRSALCYVCGEPGHRANQCGAQAPKCALCVDLGRPADHRIGSRRCTPPKKRKRANGGDVSAATAANSGNLNHCRGAQDLLQQCLVDSSVSLAVVAEPYRVPEHPRWVGDDAQSVAVYWAGGEGDPPCSRLHSERGIVAVEWGPLAVLGCYVSPNCTLGAFETFLDRVANCVRSCLPRPVLVMGDFNAHSRVWGNRRDSPRGEATLEWAAGLDLRLLNRGSVSTCVRWQGESVVDLSWATLSAERLITGWRVADELVTLSDHRHILVDVVLRLPAADARSAEDRPRRWALKRLNQDLLVAAAHVVDWSGTAEGDDRLDPEREAIKLRGDMTAICDIAMPRVRPGWRRPVYWWSEHIARLRAACLRARRQYTRARRRRSSGVAEREEKYVEYRAATTLLQGAIAESKARNWSALVEGLDRDPWGRPYKMVLGKLRPWVPPLTETLDPLFVDSVVDSLFPGTTDETGPPAALPDPSTWSDELAVTPDELDGAIRRMARQNTAPGPDGIPGQAWALALTVLGERLQNLYTACFRYGRFPSVWRQARLVLLHKWGKPRDSPSAYRPICLLDEAGKLFERIISSRISQHLACHGPDLSENQFGFRQRRSTVDAIIRVRTLSEQAISQGRVVLAVSLDIVNAFNSLPWRAILEGLSVHQVPSYLMAVLKAYLSDRRIRFPGRYGSVRGRNVVRGVPQGSVLGSLLWNVAYDAVLRTVLPDGVSIVCYADDTLVLTEGVSYTTAVRLAEVGVARVIANIRRLGLRVASQKTEAIWFHGRRPITESAETTVRVGESDIRIGRIGREESAQCHHCGHDEDSAQHTLQYCPAWDSQRRNLVEKVGPDLSPPAIVGAMEDAIS